MVAKRMVAKRILVCMTAILVAVCMCACRTTSGSEHDQIVRTAIDLSGTYVSQGRPEDALEVYDRALEEADDYRLYFNKALILTSMSRNEEAAELCIDAFGKYPYILQFKKLQAYNSFIAGNVDAAEAAIQELLSLNPYDSETRTQYIEELMKGGLTEKAYEQALILWNQGFKDKQTVGYLYELKPDVWGNVYRQLNK